MMPLTSIDPYVADDGLGLREQTMPIDTPDDLRQHIEVAIKVEMTTIPPYLFAMYSIADPDSEAALLIRSIVAEEMLHAALATNLLLAVGGKPDFAGTRYMPTYPMDLPHHQPSLQIDLARCSLDLIEGLFMSIEQPETHKAPPAPDEFESLGQFYHALEQGLTDMSRRFDLFSAPREAAQMSDSSFYRPVQMDAEDSGGLMLINDLDSAIGAIEIIIHQGEGLSHEKWADPGHQELTHYHKLLRISDGFIPLGDVIPLRTNPRAADYPSDIALVADLFNALYRAVYMVMGRIFLGGEEQPKAVGALYLLMSGLLSPVARFLTECELENGEHAAPTFEIHHFGDAGPIEELTELAGQAALAFPQLSPVHETIHGLGLIL